VGLGQRQDLEKEKENDKDKEKKIDRNRISIEKSIKMGLK